MSAMDPATASQPVSEPERTGATQAGRTEKPYGDRYHKPVTVPGFVGPDFPFPPSLARLFRKLFRRQDTHAAR
jgi:hypothetical protein